LLRYTREIDLDDTNNAHSIGILAVPRGRVLDVGPGGAHVVSLLRDRGCTVWGVEVDPEAARAAQPYCERVINGDVESLDLADEFRGVDFDCVLFLDVLEHLKEPATVLRNAARLLSDEGVVVASIPNVAHAALRLELLRGRFSYRDIGLLDRTHLRFFDRMGVNELFRQAGLSIEQNLRVSRGLTETEIDLDPGDFPDEAVRYATGDPDALTYQFIVVARPHGRKPTQADATLAERLQKERDDLRRQLREAREWLENERAEAQEEMNALRRDLAVKEAYIAELRAASIRPQRIGGTLNRLRLNIEMRLNEAAVHYPMLRTARPLFVVGQRALLWLERTSAQYRDRAR